MIAHLCRIVWNRKRANLLVALELVAAFLVLFAVGTLAAFAWTSWNDPIGVDWHQVWDVEVDNKASTDDVWEGAAVATSAALERAVREFAEVEHVALSGVAPFELGGMTSDHTFRGRRIEYGANEVSDRYRDVLGLRVVEGRWFGPEDDGQAYDPVVITQRMRDDVFGSGPAIGESLQDEEVAPDESRETNSGGAGTADPAAVSAAQASRPQFARRRTRIIGVIAHYREDGEFDQQRHFALYRKNVAAPSSARDRPARHLVVRLRPGVTAAFEQTLVTRLQQAAPGWSFEVRTLERMRDSSLRMTFIPLAAVGFVAASLIAMTGLGLVGVLWQAVTQRTRELGLRRAKGATVTDVRRQIVGEMLVLTTLAVVPAAVLALQVPMSGIFYWIDSRVYSIGLAAATVTLYVLSWLCAWYPARLATRLSPADALRYE
jgi:putative ABC transport system permease protein